MEALRELDPWGEWRNPHEHPEVAHYLIEHRPTYAQSVGYIRAMRPREDHHEAARWWASAEARAHLVNGILQRGGKPLLAVEAEMGLPKWKLHYYLGQFGLRVWMRPRRGAHLILPSGDLVEGVIWAVEREAPVWAIVDSVAGWWRAEWSPASWAFRAHEPLLPRGAAWRRLVRQRPSLAWQPPEVLEVYLSPEARAAIEAP